MALLGESPVPLSNLIGAHQKGDFNPVQSIVNAACPPLWRGSIVCTMPDGTITLAGSQGTLPDDGSVLGIMLDEYANVATYPEATVSIARNGVYDAQFLVVDPSTTVPDWEFALKDIGILLEKVRLSQIGYPPQPYSPPLPPPPPPVAAPRPAVPSQAQQPPPQPTPAPPSQTPPTPPQPTPAPPKPSSPPPPAPSAPAPPQRPQQPPPKK